MRRDYIFLSGPVKYEGDGGHGWRNQVFHYASDHDWYMRVFDPTDYFDYAWSDQFQKTDRQIREFYYQAIKKATVVLVNLNDTIRSIGTGMEVQYAVDHDVPVVGWGLDNIYPWIKDSCTVVFDTLEETLEYISIYYNEPLL